MLAATHSHMSLLLPSLPPSKMKLVASTKQFTLRFVQKHVIPPVAARYLGSPVHPIRPKIHHLYVNRDRDTLWWRVSVKQVQRYKRVVRSWCARRARIAFQQALKDRGYDAEGRRIQREAESSDSGDTTQGKEGNLMGSLEITVLPPTVQQSFSTVQSDMHSLLDTLIEQNIQKSNQRQKKHNNKKYKAES